MEQQDFDLLEEGLDDLYWTTNRQMHALQDDIKELKRQLAEQFLMIKAMSEFINHTNPTFSGE